MNRRSSLFTLVELLVVVSAVSLLATMVLPSQRLALAQAKSAACQSNLRQLGAAFNLYGNEFNYYPVLTGGAWGNSHWKSQLSSYLGLTVTPDAPTELGLGVFSCPSWSNEGLAIPVPVERPDWFGGYGYNHFGELETVHGVVALGVGYRQAVKPAEVGNPAETIAMGDGSDSGAPETGCALYSHTAEATTANPGIGSRHAAGVNLAWADGHVSFRSRAELAAGKAGAVYQYPGEAGQYYYRRDK